nr:class GN sortase [Paraglaciecola sp. 20A4]
MRIKTARFRAVTLICLISGGLLFSHGIYMWAKAQLAQVLIAQAWQNALQVTAFAASKPRIMLNTVKQNQNIKPWPWADTYPVAKLQFAQQSLYVLAGASGRTMAFGPGHMSATPLPFEGGNSVITGHRDTHFSALQYLNNGDLIEVETQKGKGQYRVTKKFIVDQSQTQIIESQNQDQLTLITCYPFNSILPQPTLRFVVSAQRVIMAKNSNVIYAAK